MRIAIFSDVHGNLSALGAVLEDIAGRQVDQAVFAGDLCLVGPRPESCVRVLRERNIPAVFGNTDDWILGRQRPPDQLAALTEWTHTQLSAGAGAWLQRLPFSLTINPTADPTTALHIVHANPRDVNQRIYPSESEQMVRFGEIRQSDAELAPLIEGLPARLLAFGHMHVPSIRWVGDRLLLNASSVSMAGDGDPRAKYAVASWDGGRWTAEHVRVAYDIAPEIDAYHAAKPPGWEAAVAALKAEGTIAQRN